MDNLSNINEKIKILKDAKEILHSEYIKSDLHKKKEANPQEIIPSSPEDEEVYKLLTAIHLSLIHI